MVNKENEDYTLKKVYKVYFVLVLTISLIIFIIELILKLYTFLFLLSFLIGSIISGLLFYFTNLVLKLMIDNIDAKHNFWLISFNFLKLIIYGVSLSLIYISPMHYGIFTCFVGLLTIRLSILIEYSIIDKIRDKRRTIEKLKIKKEIKEKLRFNNILTTDSLCKLSRNDLKAFLNDDEIKEVSNSLREYELFLMGELEVIKDDDANVE